MKRRLKYPLIVEGKYDKATLSNLVEGEILLTDGFHIYKNKEMLSLLRQLAQNGPVAVPVSYTHLTLPTTRRV